MNDMATSLRSNPMALFEENYRLLLGLFPALRSSDRMELAAAGRPDLELVVMERGPYTTTLTLKKYFHGGRLINDIRMIVRVYHDARLVEVTGYQECRRVPPPHEVRAPGRYHRDERRQTNRLLNDLLRYYGAFRLHPRTCC